jgi:hypothetical protein
LTGSTPANALGHAISWRQRCTQRQSRKEPAQKPSDIFPYHSYRAKPEPEISRKISANFAQKKSRERFKRHSIVHPLDGCSQARCRHGALREASPTPATRLHRWKGTQWRGVSFVAQCRAMAVPCLPPTAKNERKGDVMKGQLDYAG